MSEAKNQSITTEEEPNNSKDKNEKKTPIDEVVNILEKGYNHQVILYGPPGTSKTYSSTIIAAKMLGFSGNDYNKAKNYLNDPKKDGSDRFKIVQFHPSYTYEDFIRGITIKMVAGKPCYEVQDKIFAEIAANAANNKANKYILIIDEINRAPLSSVLGELIYGLEYRGEPISTPYKIDEKSEIVIPDNLYIIGTMNTADRSIGSMDYAVRRRFAFVHLPSDINVIKESWKNNSESESWKKEIGEHVLGLYDAVKNLFEDKIVDTSIDKEDIILGHTYFLHDEEKCKSEEEAVEYMNYRLNYQIKPILTEYVKDGLLDRGVIKTINNWNNIDYFTQTVEKSKDDQTSKDGTKTSQQPSEP